MAIQLGIPSYLTNQSNCAGLLSRPGVQADVATSLRSNAARSSWTRLARSSAWHASFTKTEQSPEPENPCGVFTCWSGKQVRKYLIAIFFPMATAGSGAEEKLVEKNTSHVRHWQLKGLLPSDEQLQFKERAQSLAAALFARVQKEFNEAPIKKDEEVKQVCLTIICICAPDRSVSQLFALCASVVR